MKELLKQKLNSNPSDCKKKKKTFCSATLFCVKCATPPPHSP